MDTSHLEHIAEDLVAHRLQRAHLFVAKPKFDVKGTDLLVFSHMKDGVKFCRVQCKGRTLESGSTSIEIDSEYVSKGLVLFLYLETREPQERLYCFFAHDIERWSKNSKGQYSLSVSRGTYAKKLAEHAFSETTVLLIETLISQAESSGEFSYLSVFTKGAVLAGSVAGGSLTGYVPK